MDLQAVLENNNSSVMLCFRYFMQIVVGRTAYKTVRPRTVVLSLLPVSDIGVLWPNGWMDQGETWHEGRPRPWPHCVMWGPSSPPKKWGHNPQFSAHVCSNQTAGWIKIPLGGEVGLCSGDIVLDGDPASASKSGAAPTFWPMCIVSKRSPISATAELLFLNCCRNALLCVVSCCWRAVCRVWNNAKTSQSQLSKVLQTWFRWLYHIC